MTSPRRLGSNPLHHTTTTTTAKQQSVSQKVEGWPTLGQNDLIVLFCGYSESHSAAKQRLDHCKIMSDGVLITVRWRSDRSQPAIFWNPWSNKSEWWPPEGDNSWNLLFSSWIADFWRHTKSVNARVAKFLRHQCKSWCPQNLTAPVLTTNALSFYGSKMILDCPNCFGRVQIVLVRCVINSKAGKAYLNFQIH